jgi:hypothetical protein
MRSGSLTYAEVKVALKYRTGLLWNNRLAYKYGRAPDKLCPLCHQEDGGTHMVSACQHQAMQGMYTERHNKLGRIIMRAILKGDKGGEVVSMDLGASSKTIAEGIHITTRRYVPAEILTHLHGCELRKLKPDALLVSGERNTDRQSRQVHILELKTCRDTDPRLQLQHANEQHNYLRQKLIEEGYQARNIHILPLLVGVSGTIYHKHTLQTLEQLGISKDRAKRCASKLHIQAISSMHSIVTTRYALAHSCASKDRGTQHHPP